MCDCVNDYRCAIKNTHILAFKDILPICHGLHRGHVTTSAVCPENRTLHLMSHTGPHNGLKTALTERNR